jgi:hypothetical protein
VRQAALDGTTVSHISAGACGHPAGRDPATMVAEASTCHAKPMASRSPRLPVTAPMKGQARRKDWETEQR